jgi:hypothetical protein
VPRVLPDGLGLTIAVWSILGWKRLVVDGWRML